MPGGFFLYLLSAVFRGVTGYMLIRYPLMGAETLTLVLASFFIVGGVFRAVGSAVAKFPRWGWAVFSGVVSTIIGAMLLAQMPISGLWFIGFAIGIDLFQYGFRRLDVGDDLVAVRAEFEHQVQRAGALRAAEDQQHRAVGDGAGDVEARAAMGAAGRRHIERDAHLTRRSPGVRHCDKAGDVLGVAPKPGHDGGSPEAAAEFISVEMARPDRAPFDAKVVGQASGIVDFRATVADRALWASYASQIMPLAGRGRGNVPHREARLMQRGSLKRFRRRGASIALEPANTSYEVRILPPNRVRIQGKLIGLYRKY